MPPSAALLVALLFQSPGGAPAPTETGTPSVRLDVRAAAGCTSRGDLEARIAARSSRIRVVDDAPLSAKVVVASSRPANVVADLVLGTAGAEQPPRRVVGRSCAEVADGIALIIAVTLDPNLKWKFPTGAAPDRPASPAALPPPVVVTASVTSVAPPLQPPPPKARGELGAALAGQAIFGPGPAVMPG